MTSQIDPDVQALRARVAELEAEVAERSVGSRRALMGLGAAVAVGAVVAGAPRQAKADVLDKIKEAIRETNELLGAISDLLFRVFSVGIGIAFPTSFMEWLRCLIASEHIGINFNACSSLKSLIGGPFSLMRTSRIDETVDKVWPAEAPPPAGHDLDEYILARAEAIRDQVRTSTAVTAANAEAQGQFGLDDEAALLAVNAAASIGHLFPLLQAHATLTFAGNMRLGQMIESLNAIEQSLASMAIENSHGQMQEVLSRHRDRGEVAAGIPGAVSLGSGRP